MRGYWVLVMLGVLWSLPGATCTIAVDYKGKDNPCKMPRNPNGPEYNGPIAREKIETQPYVPERIKKETMPVIMTSSRETRSPASTDGKAEGRSADAPKKPKKWKAVR